MNDLPSLQTTDNFPTLEDALEQLNSQSRPCDRQPGEPLERYRWFQIYVTLPPPRPYKRVAEVAGLRPNTRLIPKASRQWRWKERIADVGLPVNAFLALQKEWRTQLLREAAYIAHFNGIEETSRALARADVGSLDRKAARQSLGPLLQYQRGLLTLTEPRRKQNVAPKINEKRLHNMVLDRRIAIAGKLTRLEYEAIFGPTDWEFDPFVDGHDSQIEENLSETELWDQQPGEPDKHFYWFQIYLCLMFFQSTAQVANMAGIRQRSTLSRIARKWDWQERAVAYDVCHAGDPLARIQLQLHLLHEKSYEAHLSGLLDATSAIDTAAIGSLDKAKARRNLSPLLRRQRSFLQSFWSQYEAVEGKSADEHRDLLLASLVEEKAIKMLREERADEREIEILQRIYCPEENEG